MPDFKQFPLPDTAEGLTEADILSWQVQPGDEVAVNQIVVEVETAKAAVELPCPWAGVVTELHAEPGDTVEVGAPILTIDMDPHGSTPDTVAASESSSDGAAGSVDSVDASGASQHNAGEDEMQPLVGYGAKTTTAKRRPRKPVAAEQTTDAPGTAAGTTAPGGYVPLAKPPVRKLAKDLGIDLYALTPSTTDGVITREDVRKVADGAPASEPSTLTAAPAPSAGARERRVPVKGVRKMTAQAMTESAFTAPHVTEFLSVDVTPMMRMRDRLADSPAYAGVKLTPLAFAAKAVCLAVRRTPDVNATWDEDTGEIVYKDYVHLGIAAATPRGLIVPKVRDADAMSLPELAGALERLSATARDGKTPPEDMADGTITISNVGVFGVDTGTPIINPGESAILALGTIKDTPWVVAGELAVRKVLQLSLSFDHRVVDGQQGSQFLADVGALLGDPSMAFTF